MGGQRTKTLDKMMNDRKRFVFCPHKTGLLPFCMSAPPRNSDKPDLKSQGYLHISLIPAIFKKTNGIIDFHDPFIKNYPMIKLPCLSNELTLSE